MVGVAAGLAAFFVVGAREARAAPCPTNLPNSIYGAGGSAVTATLGAVATALAKLPDNERVSIFYWDPGACAGYNSFAYKDDPVNGNLATPPAYFKYWDASGTLTQCCAKRLAPCSELRNEYEVV